MSLQINCSPSLPHLVLGSHFPGSIWRQSMQVGRMYFMGKGLPSICYTFYSAILSPSFWLPTHCTPQVNRPQMLPVCFLGHPAKKTLLCCLSLLSQPLLSVLLASFVLLCPFSFVSNKIIESSFSGEESQCFFIFGANALRNHGGSSFLSGIQNANLNKINVGALNFK